jgi:RNA polymerase sigma-70 factor (TIGR02943 family)
MKQMRNFYLVLCSREELNMPAERKHILEPHRWVERYGDYLFNYAIVRVNDREVAEDLVQETFLAGLKSEEGFRGASSERTWLTSILKRKIVDTYRKKYTSKESSFGEFEQTVLDGDFYKSEEPMKGHWLEGKGPSSNSFLPEGELERAELMEYIRLCIENLKPQLAAAFIMKMIDEEDSDTICKELGITPSNLWVILHRARLKMRDCLEKKWLN